ncbi:MAG: Uma2 family endonuclease [Desulfococcaceae bacterium]|nr:Uma2 family endonuclease [Desulfococcaceae bacterium]
MNWQQVCENPQFSDLPFKIELNERDQIILSPARLAHGYYQFEIGRILHKIMQGQGKIVTECAIRTSKSTKVADVAWFSTHRWNQVRHEYDSPIAPEICVEVISAANTDSEMQEKKALYFEVGAAEVWFCNDGTMIFYSKNGEIKKSALADRFPETISA